MKGVSSHSQNVDILAYFTIKHIIVLGYCPEQTWDTTQDNHLFSLANSKVKPRHTIRNDATSLELEFTESLPYGITLSDMTFVVGSILVSDSGMEG